MENVFVRLVNMSLSAGWLVLAVVAVRFLFKKAPKWLHCLLWGLVAVRLLCPFSIESALSLLPSAEPIPDELISAHSTVEVSGMELLEYVTDNPVYWDLGVQNGQLVFMEYSTPDTPTVNPLKVMAFLATLLWLTGMVAMTVYVLVSTLRLRRRVGESLPVEPGVRLCDSIPTPFILGVFRPCIYLPSGMSEEQRVYVLAHERAHLRRCDHLLKPLGWLLLTVYWFNPLMWLAYILLCRDIELACDEKVVRDMDTHHRKTYSEALLACSAPRRLVSACPLAFGETSVKQRIKSVLHYKKPAFWLLIAAVVACVAVAVCFLTNPKTTVEDGTQLDSPNQTVPDVVTKENSWQTLGHPMSYAEASKVSGGVALEEYNIKNLQKLLGEVEWSSDAIPDTNRLYNAYFSLDGVTRYYVSLDTWGDSGFLYNGKQYVKLTVEQVYALDYLLADGGSTIKATHVLYGNFAASDKAERCYVLDVVQADDKTLIGKKIRVNYRNTYGRRMPYIGTMIKVSYDGTVLENTVYTMNYNEHFEGEIPQEGMATKPQNGTVTGKVIFVTSKAVLLHCYNKEQFDVVWVRFEKAYPNLSPQMREEYQVAYDGLSVETYPYQLTAKTMERVSSTPPGNGFISETKAIELAIDHWKVRLDVPDMEAGYYTTVYVIEQPTADAPRYLMGSRRVDVQDGKPQNSALFDTLYIDAVTGEIVLTAPEQK